jgi:membrane-bound serine protease (ClpP class)
MRRLLAFAFLTIAALLISGSALAHEGHDDSVVVAEVEGVLDQRVLDFIKDVVESPDGQLIVLHINSPGIASGDPGPLFDAIAVAEVPVVAWVGPQGSRAYGGALQLVAAADYAAAAPGTRLGYGLPSVASDPDGEAFVSAPGIAELADARVEIRESGARPEFIAEIVPGIGQFIASLDGQIVGGVPIETALQSLLADGTEVVIPSVEVHFVKPGLLTRFLRVGIRPEASFFFLTAGLALIAFEFYAAGVGVTAAVAALSLLLATYGLSSLPLRWWAVVAAGLGILLYTWDFQRNQLGVRSIGGTALLLGGGLYLTDAEPQFGPRSWVVVIVVIGLALFYLFAMTTVVRSRFSTRTIGRENLVGRSGRAETILAPEGVVAVDGARWQARAHRAAGIGPGDRVTVLGVEGIVLEVGPDQSSAPVPETEVSEGPDGGSGTA